MVVDSILTPMLSFQGFKNSQDGTLENCPKLENQFAVQCRVNKRFLPGWTQSKMCSVPFSHFLNCQPPPQSRCPPGMSIGSVQQTGPSFRPSNNTKVLLQLQLSIQVIKFTFILEERLRTSSAVNGHCQVEFPHSICTLFVNVFPFSQLESRDSCCHCGGRGGEGSDAPSKCNDICDVRRDSGCTQNYEYYSIPVRDAAFVPAGYGPEKDSNQRTQIGR